MLGAIFHGLDYAVHSIIHIIKMKIHSSCEIEDFVETHLCELCVILRSGVLRAAVCPRLYAVYAVCICCMCCWSCSVLWMTSDV